LYYDLVDSEYSKDKNNLDLTKISFHTGDMPNLVPSDDNFYTESTIQDSSAESIHAGSINMKLGTNRPEYITALTHDNAGPNKYYPINERIEYLVSKQGTKFDLQGVGTSFNVPFKDKHTSIPALSFSINYTGLSTPTFVNAMMIGEPTISGADFLINQAVSTDGYILNIISESEEAGDDD
jgi:hypothetical protein